MRLRRDEIKFLEAINQLINTLMMIKVRHLKSTEPIRLKNLGTEEDKEQEMQYNQNRRLLRKPGVPLKPHLFKEQGVPAKGRSSDQASRARNSSRSIPVEKGKEKDTVKDNEVSAIVPQTVAAAVDGKSIAAAEQEETDEGELKMPKMPQILAAQRLSYGE
nr:hypothetical protein BaRGS_001421 [Batillaria attramentaria]